MEAVPLSDISAAACAHALVFSWVTVLECMKQSLPIVGSNLLKMFGPSFAKC
jgi:hypothetical protein